MGHRWPAIGLDTIPDSRIRLARHRPDGDRINVTVPPEWSDAIETAVGAETPCARCKQAGRGGVETL
jgi:hypothetical protein